MSFRVNLQNISKNEQSKPNELAFDRLGVRLPIVRSRSRTYDLLIAGILVSGLGAIGVFATFGHALFSAGEPVNEATVLAAVPSILEPDTGIQHTKNAFEGIQLSAKSAIVYDVRNGATLFSREADVQKPLASITKLMTALVAHDILASDATITITESSQQVEGNSGFVTGETWQLSELTKLILLNSSNEGAQAIAATAGATLRPEHEQTSDALNRLAFVQRMNTRARDLSMTSSTFANASGLDVDLASAGGYGSARDVVRLVAHLIQHEPELIEVTTKLRHEARSLDDSAYEARNTNQFVGNIPGLILSKTGFTDLAGGNLTIAYDHAFNHPIIIVVLDSTFEDRFTDVDTLVQATTVYLNGATK